MARWQPDARGRLLLAAVDLFTEQGYDATTAAHIAQRAGLTKTTLFRLFADKREILFQGQAAQVSTAAAGVSSAPEGASAVDLLHCGLQALCAEHVPEQQELGRRINSLIATSEELQERAAFKRATIAAALSAAMAARLQDPRQAVPLADVGVRAYYDGFAAWTDARRAEGLAEVVLDELDGLLSSLRSALTGVTPSAGQVRRRVRSVR
ncbi:AcrR family transcriptional regulator [Motilibacter peucedani]|uniref:AcrR family transcriptional regulator n=1 Tax=Motilibacter peucedani TaxID=598650 RepID=A0A420XQN8_9ACTN|nr:TetR/AcrR family transcriptional regulator [Motilibacter peucedani]RKS75579.1 AcrR family transcriptional regulator [Motilibacter peucedani]